MNTDFTNAIAVDKLLIKGVKINIDEILDNDSDGDSFGTILFQEQFPVVYYHLRVSTPQVTVLP